MKGTYKISTYSYAYMSMESAYPVLIFFIIWDSINSSCFDRFLPVVPVLMSQVRVVSKI